MPFFNHLTHTAMDISRDSTDLVLDVLKKGDPHLSNAVFSELGELGQAEVAFGFAQAHHANFAILEGLALQVSAASNEISQTLEHFHVSPNCDLARDANDLTADLTVYTQGIVACSLFDFVV